MFQSFLNPVRGKLEALGRRIAHRVEPESGQSLVLVALAMTAILGMAALVLDGASILTNHRMAQNASDAASRAATQALALRKSNSEIYNCAKAYTVGGASCLGKTVAGNGASSFKAYYVKKDGGIIEVVLGLLIDDDDDNVWKDIRSVRVIATRQFNPLFAGIFGYNTLTTQGKSTNTKMKLAAVTNMGVWPVAVPEDKVKIDGTTFVWDTEKEGPGNAGWLDLNGGSNSNNELRNWVLNDYNVSASTPVKVCPNGDKGSSCTNSSSFTWPNWMIGMTGIKSSSIDAAATRVGQTIMVFVYDKDNGEGGSNFRYHITKVAMFTITEVSNKTIKGQFVRWVLSAPVAAEDGYDSVPAVVRMIQ